VNLLAGVDLAGLSDDQKATAFIVARKIKAFADHVQLVILGGFDDTTELAMAVKEPEQAVVRQKILSEVLETLPRLSDQLRRGELDLRRLEAVHERVANLPSQDMITQIEDALVDVAPGLNRTQLARKATGLVATTDPAGYQQRCEKARAERRVEFKPLPDGMAQLKAVLGAVEAHIAGTGYLPRGHRRTRRPLPDRLVESPVPGQLARRVRKGGSGKQVGEISSSRPGSTLTTTTTKSPWIQMGRSAGPHPPAAPTKPNPTSTNNHQFLDNYTATKQENGKAKKRESGKAASQPQKPPTTNQPARVDFVWRWAMA
jgi:hypothetical protein